MARVLDALSECPDCGLLQRLPASEHGQRVVCVRCEATLHRHREDALAASLACSGAGLCLLLLACTEPLAGVAMRTGRSTVSTLLSGPEAFEESGATGLAVVVVLTLLVLPAFKLIITGAMVLALWIGRVPALLKRWFVAIPPLSDWAMVDVFMLGSLISLTRLGAWMQVHLGFAFFALAGVALCSVGVDSSRDLRAFWQRLPALRPTSRRVAGGEWMGCTACGTVQRSRPGNPCPRCGRRLERRKVNSIGRTWALIIAAALLALPANFLPVMTIRKFGEGGPSTIIGGTIELAERGFWPLAVLVFVASILVPLLKLGALGTLLVMTSRRSAAGLKARTKVYRAVVIIGRWSMLDIFATMVLVMLARFAWVGSIVPGPGASAFCAVVLLTMLASEAFDPRLMWDAAGRSKSPAMPEAAWGQA